MMKKLPTLLCSMLVAGSLTAQAQAAFNPESHDSGQNLDKTIVGKFVATISNLFATDNQVSDNEQYRAEIIEQVGYHHQKVTLHRTAGTNGMFRRVVNAPSAGGRMNTTRSMSGSSSTITMSLRASAPSGMDLQSKDYEWVVKSTDGSISKRSKGKKSTFSLPPGRYKVRLTVGSTVETKTVKLSNETKSFSLAVSTGNLKAKASFDGGSSVKATWTVYKMKNGKRSKKVYGPTKGRSIKRALAPGKYEVVAAIGRVVKKKKVTVAGGKTASASIRLSGSKVKLQATKKDNKTPLMKKTTWIIKNEANEIVARPKRHTATITLPPGKYIASATNDDGASNRKTFVVKPGASSKVYLAMDK